METSTALERAIFLGVIQEYLSLVSNRYKYPRLTLYKDWTGYVDYYNPDGSKFDSYRTVLFYLDTDLAKNIDRVRAAIADFLDY